MLTGVLMAVHGVPVNGGKSLLSGGRAQDYHSSVDSSQSRSFDCPAEEALTILKLLMKRNTTRRAIAAALAGLLVAGVGSAQVTSVTQVKAWNKIRYQGGTVEAKVNPFDWNTTLTVRQGELELVFAGRKRVVIPVADVGRLSYGQKAYRRVADMAVLSVFATPVALFGLLHKSKDHIVSVEYRMQDGKTGAVLLTVHKDQYEDLLRALQAATGKPVENWP
ncbi:MAG: hypothetical protein NTW74_16680 [Acidobacteria bacterium]|nr:hypothetical protein [Acidobacteriota bacterium]